MNEPISHQCTRKTIIECAHDLHIYKNKIIAGDDGPGILSPRSGKLGGEKGENSISRVKNQCYLTGLPQLKKIHPSKSPIQWRNRAPSRLTA